MNDTFTSHSAPQSVAPLTVSELKLLRVWARLVHPDTMISAATLQRLLVTLDKVAA